MDPYQRAGGDFSHRNESSGNDFGQQLVNLGHSLVAYLRSRSPEHWLFFAVGIIVGLWIG